MDTSQGLQNIDPRFLKGLYFKDRICSVFGKTVSFKHSSKLLGAQDTRLALLCFQNLIRIEKLRSIRICLPLYLETVQGFP